MPKLENGIGSLSAEFSELMRKAVNDLGISPESIQYLQSVEKIKFSSEDRRRNKELKQFAVVAIGITLLAIIVSPILLYKFIMMRTEVGYQIFDKYYQYMYDSTALDEMCVVPTWNFALSAFRTPINCSECENVAGVHRVSNLSQQEFLEKYAFSMQPVLIKDGQDGWTAKDVFSFDFFRNVYSEGSEALDKVNNDCQFFPYRTEFNNLGEMLNMSRDRVEGKEKPWYVGWSNCDGKAANILRKHYKFPYFLPPELDHSKTDWVFMGLPGYGAFMHIDSVDALSWQAQVRGTKKWILESPPECGGRCIRRMEIIVEPGDIIVLDTNKWFHSTLIMGNETSIVIGSEYY